MRDEVPVDPFRPYGLLSVCPVPGCRTMTMGGTCVAPSLAVLGLHE